MPSSVATDPDALGRPLLAASLGVALAVAAGNLAPPSPWFAWPALALAMASGWRGLARRERGAGWWLACGLMVGAAACSLAPRRPAVPARGGLPVTFSAMVRDAWQAGPYGWEARVRLERVEIAGRRLRTAREVRLTVGGQAAPSRLPAPGEGLRGAGELEFDPGWALARPRLRVKSPLLLAADPRGSPVDRMREAGVRALLDAAGVDPARIRAAGLAGALLFDRREMLAAGDVDLLRRSGLAHLLAVSGLNVGMVAGMAWFALGLVGLPPRWRRLLVLAAVVGFTLIAGGGAPVRRAGIAAALYIVARLVGRHVLALPAVAGVVATLLVVEPAALLEPSFQLSAAVTLALVRWVEPLGEALKRWLGRGAPAVAVTLVAQAASAPLVGHHFGGVPLLGAPVNLLAVPISFVAMAASLLTAFAGFAGAALARLPLEVVRLCSEALAWLSRPAASGTVTCPALPIPLALALAAGFVLALSPARRRALAGGLGAAAAFAAWLLVPRPGGPAGWELRMLPVRDGAALLVRSAGHAVLVDAGSGAREAARALRDAHVGRLAAAVVTHADSDHTGGMMEVLRSVPVDVLVYPGATADRAEIVGLRRLARAHGAREVAATRGQRVTLGDAVCDVVWPGGAAVGGDNDSSLMLACGLGGLRLLIAGDIEATGESELLAAGPSPLAADVLQLGHHGSRTSSSAAFLAAVGPRVAFAATGTHPRFPFPSPTVLERVRLLPAVSAVQIEEVSGLRWNGDGRVIVGTKSPVAVRLAGRP